MRLILLVVGVAAVIPMALLPRDWAGWLLLYASFALVPFALARQKMSIIIAIWTTLLAHHSIAIYNAYVGLVPGADMDALDFHNAARLLASLGGFKLGVGVPFYNDLLGAAYSVFGASQFLGEETSVLAFALSCVVLVKLMELLEIERGQAAAILVFGLLPGVAIFTSLTLRESWQVLLFACAVYSILRFRITADPRALLGGAAATIGLGLLHNGLLAYGLAFLPYGLLFRLGLKKGMSLPRALAMGLAGLVLLAVVAAFLAGAIPRSPAIQAVTEGESLEYAAKYREQGSKKARATYGVSLETGSAAGFAESGALLYLLYFFAPLPWQVGTSMDVVAFLDVWMRAALVFFAFLSFLSRRGAQAQVRGFLLGCYFSMSLLWALGTVNYGTGIRHHVVAIWIVVALGVPEGVERLRAFLGLSDTRAKASG